MAKMSDKIYDTLLYVYPEDYSSQYGRQMNQTFRDLYREAKAKDGSKGVFSLWLGVLGDLLISAVEEHLYSIKHDGLKKHLVRNLHINRYGVLGALLLVPFLIMFTISALVTLFSPASLPALYASPVHAPGIFMVFGIVFPILAILINGFSLLHQIKLFSPLFIRTNLFALGVVALGAGVLLLIFGHDFIPCLIRGGAFNYCRLYS